MSLLGTGNALHLDKELLKGPIVHGQSGYRHGPKSIPVEALFKGQKHFAPLIPPVVVVLQGHFDADLGGRGSIVRKEQFLLVPRQDLDQFLGQPYGRLVGKAAEDHLVQSLHPLHHPLQDIGIAMAVHTGVPGGDPVHIVPSGSIVQQGPLCPGDGQHLGAELVLGQGMPQMFFIPLNQFFQCKSIFQNILFYILQRLELMGNNFKGPCLKNFSRQTMGNQTGTGCSFFYCLPPY